MRPLLPVILFCLASGSPARAADGPDVVIRRTVDDVLAAMRESRDPDKLRRFVEQEVLPHFDFARMTRLACGRHCARATPEQREALERAFRALLVRTYTASLAMGDPYRATVDLGPFMLRPGDVDAQVRTLIRRPGAPALSVDYRVSLDPDGWKVYDVLVEGISIVSNYRGQFSEEINRSGLDGLIRALEAKTR